MEKYVVQLIIDEEKCYDCYDDNCSLYDCFCCTECTAMVVINSSDKIILDTSNKLNGNLEDFFVGNYLIETNDNVNEDNFFGYLIDKKSDYRVTDLQDDRILIDFDFNLEFFNDLIEEYGLNNIYLYNRDYDVKDIEREISKLNVSKIIYLLLATGFKAGMIVSIFQLFNGNVWCALGAGVLSYIGNADTCDIFYQKCIDVKTKKRLLMKEKNKDI